MRPRSDSAGRRAVARCDAEPPRGHAHGVLEPLRGRATNRGPVLRPQLRRTAVRAGRSPKRLALPADVRAGQLQRPMTFVASDFMCGGLARDLEPHARAEHSGRYGRRDWRAMRRAGLEKEYPMRTDV